jgi:hypothetical protein
MGRHATVDAHGVPGSPRYVPATAGWPEGSWLAEDRAAAALTRAESTAIPRHIGGQDDDDRAYARSSPRGIAGGPHPGTHVDLDDRATVDFLTGDYSPPRRYTTADWFSRK